MISFFDPLPEEPPRPPDPIPHRTPPWIGPPDDVLPGVVGLELPLVHNDRQVMWIGAAELYPEGMAFSVLMCGRRAAPMGVESGSGTWRFGVQFSDQRKTTVHGVGMFSGVGGAVSSVGAAGRTRAVGISGDRSQPPHEMPVLRALGGGGGRSASRQQYWLWPRAAAWRPAVRV